MGPYSRENKGFKYIMLLINCFTKFIFAKPLKTKTAIEVATTLEPILKKHKMCNLQTDQGKEFFNFRFKRLMEKYGINHYSTYSDKKASISERAIRTVKGKMWRIFTEKGNYEWLSILPQVIKQYNNSVLRTIGMRPNEVSAKDEKAILKHMSVKVIHPLVAKFRQ